MFLLTLPFRVDMAVPSCAQGATCRAVTTCHTVLGWADVLGPLSCSRWAAAGAGLLIGVALRAVGLWRGRRAAL